MRMNHDTAMARNKPKRRPRPKADRSLVDMLGWCGVHGTRALDLVADAHTPEGAMLLHEMLGNDIKVCTIGNDLCFNARLGAATWNGRRLRIKIGEMPDTLTGTMPGRRLVDVVGHGALPRERTVASARLDDGMLTLDTEGDEIGHETRSAFTGLARVTKRLARTRSRHLRSAAKDAWSLATVQAGIAVAAAFGVQLAIALTLFHDTRLASATAIMTIMLATSLTTGVIALYLCVKADPKDLRDDHFVRMQAAKTALRSRWEAVST